MSNKKMYTLLAIFAIVFFTLIILLSRLYTNKNTGVPEEMQVMIEKNWWSGDVAPVLYKPNLKLINFSEKFKTQQIDNGVSFEEFKDYLMQLADMGYQPMESYGCQHPSLISPHIDPNTIEDFTWIGYTDEYRVNAIWKKEGTDPLVSNVKISVYKREDSYGDYNTMDWSQFEDSTESTESTESGEQ